MKILFLTDTHFRSQNPISRTDNFIESILEKFEWVLEYADKKKIEIIIHGGDFWDSPRVSDDVACQVANLISAHHPDFYTILGQHDIIGKNLETSGRTKSGLFNHFSNFYLMTTPIGFNEFIIHPFNFDIENPVPNEVMVDYVVGKVNIAVVHGLIADQNMIINGKRKLIKWDVVTTNADLVLSGDYHPGYGMQHHNLCGTFVNPGSFARMDASDAKLGRTPQVAIITIKKASISKIRLLQVPSKPNPFNLSKLEAKITVKEQKDRFIEALKELSDTRMAGDNVLELLDSSDYPKKIRNRCREKIKELSDE